MQTKDATKIPLSRITGCAERIVAVLASLLQVAGQSEKPGGYLVVLDTRLGGLSLIGKVGHFREEDHNIPDHYRESKRFFEGALTRAEQLFEFSALVSYLIGRRPGPGFGRRAGAVRGSTLIFSLQTYLDQFWDEAVVFVLAIELGQLSKSDVLAQISEERNSHLRPLLEACNWIE